MLIHPLALLLGGGPFGLSDTLFIIAPYFPIDPSKLVLQASGLIIELSLPTSQA